MVDFEEQNAKIEVERTLGSIDNAKDLPTMFNEPNFHELAVKALEKGLMLPVPLALIQSLIETVVITKEILTDDNISKKHTVEICLEELEKAFKNLNETLEVTTGRVINYEVIKKDLKDDKDTGHTDSEQ